MKLTYRQALEASLSLAELNKLKLPIRTSIQIARLSNLIDSELKFFCKTRDRLVKEYKINPQHSDKEDIMSFSTGVDLPLKEQTLKEFVAKFDELLETETPDWDIKITLPDDLVFTPKLLKAIEGFLAT